MFLEVDPATASLKVCGLRQEIETDDPPTSSLYAALHCYTVDTLLCAARRRSALPYAGKRCYTLLYVAIPCDTPLDAAVRWCTLLYIAIR